MKTLILRLRLAAKQHKVHRLSWAMIKAEREQHRLAMECKELCDQIARRLQNEGYAKPATKWGSSWPAK